MTDRSDDIVTSDALTEFLSTEWLGRPCACFRQLSSTMDAARRIATASGGYGTVVIADSQFQGRGSRGRVWESRQGLGIWCSAVLPYEVPAAPTALVIAAAVVKTMESMGLTGVGVKWPNDVVVVGANGYRKLAGILVEPVSDTSKRFIAGIGLNVNHVVEDFATDLREIATSMHIVSGRAFHRSEVLAAVLGEIESRYSTLHDGGEADLKALVDEWQAVSATIGRTVLMDSEGTTGTAVAIQSDGALVVEHSGRRSPIYSGTAAGLEPSAMDTRE